MSKSNFTNEIKVEYKKREREIQPSALFYYNARNTINDFINVNYNNGQKVQDSNVYIRKPLISGTLQYRNLLVMYGKRKDLLEGNFPMTFEFTLQPGTYTFQIKIGWYTEGTRINDCDFNISINTRNADGTTGGETQFLLGMQSATSQTPNTNNYSIHTFTKETIITFKRYSYDCSNVAGYTENDLIKAYEISIREGIVKKRRKDEISYDLLTFGNVYDDCQLLDFNVDETSDIYYEKMPFSELTIDVDNTYGYFSEFSEHSIVDKLNKSFIIINTKINDTASCETWEMSFNSVKADNEKATLTFQPLCSNIFNEQITDTLDYFSSSTPFNKEHFQYYIYQNYGYNLKADSDYGSFTARDDEGRILKNTSDLFVAYASDLTEEKEPQMLTIDDNYTLNYKLVSTQAQSVESITTSEMLEKPKTTRAELEGALFTHSSVIDVQQEYTQFNKVITSTCDTLLIYCDGLNALDITENDITLTNANLISISVSYYNLAPLYLIIKVQKTNTSSYTININANMRKLTFDENQIYYSKNEYEDTKKSIKVKGGVNAGYWKYLIENLEKKVKLKIIALPYLQVGDCIEYELETYENEPIMEKIVITEIHTSWSNGFIMNITGYKINEEI